MDPHHTFPLFSTMASFAPLIVDVNPTEWGPTAPPSQLAGISYAPFAKNERLGVLANFLEGPSRAQPVKGALLSLAFVPLAKAA